MLRCGVRLLPIETAGTGPYDGVSCAPAFRRGSSEWRHGELRFEISAARGHRRGGYTGVAGMGGHRDHVVARDVGRTRPAAREAGVGLQRIAIRIPDRAELQGKLHRDRDRGDLCVSLAQPARHRSGQRDRDRDHDGRERRDLSGVRTDEERVRGVFAGGLSSGGRRLLRRRGRQHAVVPVQRLDADPLLQQGPVPCRRPRSRSAAEDLA